MIATHIIHIGTDTVYTVDDLLDESTLTGAEIVTLLNAQLGSTVWQGGGSGTPAWGAIVGALADQTDLQAELDAKAASSHTHTLSQITDVTVSSDMVAITKAFRPGLYDDLDSPPVGTIFEGINDGHLYWCHRDGSVHLLCADGGYGGGGAVSWGDITGDLTFQTDLYAALVGKQANSAALTQIASVAATADSTLVYMHNPSTAAGVNFPAFGRTLVSRESASEARISLGLTIGNEVQAWDAKLDAIAGLSAVADRGIYFTGSGSASLFTLTTAARALLDDANAASMRSTLGLVINTNVQAYDADLAAIAGLTSAADKAPYFTGSGTAATMTVTSAARALLDDADAASMRNTLNAQRGLRLINESVARDQPVNVIIFSDSTGMNDDRWPVELLRLFRVANPTLCTTRRNWDTANSRWKVWPEEIRSGSAAYWKEPGGNGASAAPSGAITHVSGSQGLAAKVRSDDWATDCAVTNSIIAAIHGSADPNRGLHLMFNGTRIPRVQWYTAGTSASVVSVNATTAIADTALPIWIAVDVVTNNGSGQYEVRFYTKLDADANWVQLGTTITGGSTTTIPAVTSPLYFGRRSSSVGGWLAEVHEGMWWTGSLAGTPVYRAHWQAALSRKRGYVDAYGVRWTEPQTGKMTNNTNGLQLLNRSISGASAVDVTTGDLTAIGADPQLAIVSYSHNHGTETDIAQIVSLCDRIRTRWPHIAIAITAQNPKRDAHANVNEHAARCLKVMSYAAQNNWPFIDAYRAFLDYAGDWTTDLMTDDTHPNPAGYVVWGALAAEVLL